MSEMDFFSNHQIKSMIYRKDWRKIIKKMTKVYMKNWKSLLYPQMKSLTLKL